jgi:hypothetical protein
MRVLAVSCSANSCGKPAAQVHALAASRQRRVSQRRQGDNFSPAFGEHVDRVLIVEAKRPILRDAIRVVVTSRYATASNSAIPKSGANGTQ